MTLAGSLAFLAGYGALTIELACRLRRTIAGAAEEARNDREGMELSSSP